jgi:uncharacterized protein YfaS (alpha-2-macroglobulin family)
MDLFQSKGLVMRALILAIVTISFCTVSAVAQDLPLVPQKRVTISQGQDLPGGDVAQIFDTTLEACEKACLSMAQCTAFTFNTRNGSCFPKANPGAATPYDGAVSAVVLPTDPAVAGGAAARRGDLAFLSDSDLAQARGQAQELGRRHYSNGFAAEDHLRAARDAEAQGNVELAMRFLGAAVTLSDQATDWAEYARLLLLASDRNGASQFDLRTRALLASVNGYLRTDSGPLRHTLLVLMGEALEKLGRGRDTVQALRLAQALQPRDDTAALLEDAIGKYGFRITEHQVQADSPRPRICAIFSEDLSKSGVDYESFVQLPEPGLTVTSDGGRMLCVEGVAHGARYALVFREGLPAADGQVLARSVPVTAYVRDRTAQVRFPGRAYVLPRGEGAALPVVTVNTERLDLTLYRVTDRNLLRAFQSGYFSQPMADWQEENFRGEVGAQVWSGTATVGQEVNRDVTTRLPMAEALRDRPAGVYALKAAVPGEDPYEVAPGWQWFVVSDLGMTTFSGADGLHVIVRSLGSAGPKAGITVELLSRANDVLATATTDAIGHARFDAGLTRGTAGQAPALVVAREGAADAGGDLAFLSLGDPEFDLSDRGVAGREAAPVIDLFLTTDRGAYRAGETVNVTALARDDRAAALTGLPLTAILKRPDGVEFSRQQVSDTGGGYVLALPIPGTAPRGVWRLDMLADLEAAPLGSRTFLVEDFLPERIDVSLTLPETPLTRLDNVPLQVSARYLFGAPGADLSVEGEVLLRAATGLPGFPGYVFGPQDAPFAARMESFGGLRTDAAGQGLIDVSLPPAEEALHPLEARFTVRVAEGSGRPVERQITRPLQPDSALIGVKPLFDGVVAMDSEARFDLIALGAAQMPAAGLPAKWVISRIETEYQWYQSYGNWNWEPVTTRSIVAEGKVTLGPNPVQIAAPVAWGEYELKVEAEGMQYAVTSTTFHAGWYAPADVSSTPDTLDLSLDASAYRPGDTARLRIVPRAAGTAIISVLSNRLIHLEAVEVAEGENLVPLQVTDDWGAGVYVTASVLRPMDRAAGRNPSRALGLAYASIDPGPRKLATSLDVMAEASPRSPLDITLRVSGIAPGETAYATIAAVDQGILNLTAFTPPDPSAHYFGQRKLGVGIRDLYGRLIDGLNGAEGQVRSGGDAGAQARLQSPPPTEELLAWFTGPVEVGADGLAHARFDLPAFNGSVKVMAVVWSGSGIGQASADVLVRDPVVVTASLPRFMAPGDESRVLLEIVHASGPAGRMGLDVAGRGVSLGDVPSGFDLAPGGKAVFALPLRATEAGLHALDVTLTTPDGKVLTKTLSLPVMANDPEVMRVTRLVLAPGQTLRFDTEALAGLVPGSARASLAIGPLARINAPGLLAALDAYPYGCTEQITSKALPLLYFDQVAQALDLNRTTPVRARLDQSVTEILTNQGADGSFGLWGPGRGDLWLDAYVTDFLSRARAMGIAVPDLAFRQALDNLRNQVNYAADFDAAANGGGEDLAYALMVLAREGAAAIGDLRYYADVKGDDFRTALAQAQLGAALASYGDQPRADAMFRRAAARTEALMAEDQEQIWRSDFGSNSRDAAALLTLAVESGTKVMDLDRLIGRIAAPSRPLSTQEATWALMAANALIDRPDSSAVLIDGRPADGPMVRLLTPGSAPVTVQNTGPETEVTLTTFGAPSEPEPAGGNGYAISRSYYALDGTPATMEALRVGDRLVAVLEITPFARGEARLMVNDALPAGFEIDNPNLISGGSLANLDWLQTETDVTHSEFRQDRFLTAIDRNGPEPFRLAYVVRAVSPGDFHHPAALVEDMYRPGFRARSETGRVAIAP